jgi:transposase
MQPITTIGLDIAKSVFQVHGIDAAGNVLIRRQLKRRYVLAFFEKLSPCLVGIEACATSHHWSRQLKALGHTVRLMPPAYVKPYVKRLAFLVRRTVKRDVPWGLQSGVWRGFGGWRRHC